jgi:hypothetical protein
MVSFLYFSICSLLKVYFNIFYLGELCGLLPKCEPTSQQLHTVVELSSGIRDSNSGNLVGPVDRLKEALSSKLAFQGYYLVI